MSEQQQELTPEQIAAGIKEKESLIRALKATEAQTNSAAYAQQPAAAPVEDEEQYVGDENADEVIAQIANLAGVGRGAQRAAEAKLNQNAAAQIDPLLVAVGVVLQKHQKLVTQHRAVVDAVAALDLTSALSRIPENRRALPRVKANNPEAGKLIPLQWTSDHEVLVMWHRLAVELRDAFAGDFLDLKESAQKLEGLKHDSKRSTFISPAGEQDRSMEMKQSVLAVETFLSQAQRIVTGIEGRVTNFARLQQQVGELMARVVPLPSKPPTLAATRLPLQSEMRPVAKDSRYDQGAAFWDDPRTNSQPAPPPPSNVHVQRVGDTMGSGGFRVSSKDKVQPGLSREVRLLDTKGGA